MIPGDMMRRWNFTGDFGVVHAEVKETKGQPGPGKKELSMKDKGYPGSTKITPAS